MRLTKTLSLATVLPLVIALSACAGMHGAGTDSMEVLRVPAAIAVPSGNKLFFTLRASGLQNYECRAKAGAAGGYDWVLVGPEAALYDKSDSLVGRHYGGPTWEYGDDSKVVGKEVAEAPAPKPLSLAWVLMQGTPAPRTGVMSGVTYVQRINTDGGVAPSDTCSAGAVGTKKGVRYSADYLFYKAE